MLPSLVQIILLLLLVVGVPLALLYFKLTLVTIPPGCYAVLADRFLGKFAVLESGLHRVPPWAGFFISYVKNPWDNGKFWPLEGKRIEYDPEPILVTCKLGQGNGTASGTCDVRIIMNVQERVTDKTVAQFEASRIKDTRRFINALVNEYVRRVCHTLQYEECHVKNIWEALMAHREEMSERVKQHLLTVESFVVENVSFNLDNTKQKQDTREYELIRRRRNQELERDIMVKENEAKLQEANLEYDITMKKATADSEAKVLGQKMQYELEEKHREKMVELLGNEQYSRILAMEALVKALGTNTHLISPNLLGIADLFQRVNPDGKLWSPPN